MTTTDRQYQLRLEESSNDGEGVYYLVLPDNKKLCLTLDLGEGFPTLEISSPLFYDFPNAEIAAEGNDLSMSDRTLAAERVSYVRFNLDFSAQEKDVIDGARVSNPQALFDAKPKVQQRGDRTYVQAWVPADSKSG